MNTEPDYPEDEQVTKPTGGPANVKWLEAVREYERDGWHVHEEPLRGWVKHVNKDKADAAIAALQDAFARAEDERIEYVRRYEGANTRAARFLEANLEHAAALTSAETVLLAQRREIARLERVCQAGGEER